MSTPEKLKERFAAITIKRELLVQLSLKDNLGTLSIDVIQALEELDLISRTKYSCLLN
jgi:hypothetical protein